MRFLEDGYALFAQRGVDLVDVGDAEVEDGALGDRGFVRCADGQAYGAALEEGHVAGIEEEPHTEGVLIKVFGLREIVDGEGDLSDFVQVDLGVSGFGRGSHDVCLQ